MSGDEPRSDRRLEQLAQLLRDEALVIAEVTLASGARASYYVDCRRARFRAPGLARVGALVAAHPPPLGARAVGGLALGAAPLA
ncbi:MAG: hypothetical protein K6T27_09715, partial [Thermoleophilum sp.]|nr:hypothetical protein [Thermoleophilum sp.]